MTYKYFKHIPTVNVFVLPFLTDLGKLEKQNLAAILDIIEKTIKFSITWVLAIALIALMITGYKYTTSAVNPQAAEQTKKSFLYILFGVLIVLGFYGFLEAIRVFVS